MSRNGRPKVWPTLASFQVYPKKTFFGLDRGHSHCFTLPKDVTEEYIQYFELMEGQLQRKIFLMIYNSNSYLIDNKKYPLMIRRIRINRSKPYKLKPEDMPKRDVVQFDWRKYPLTQSIMKENTQETYDMIKLGEDNKSYDLKFHHLEDNIFLVRFPELLSSAQNQS